MVEFETIKAEEMKFGNNNFVEVAKKKAITDEGENVFISISRGFITQEGERRYRKSFSLPLEDEVLSFVSEKILEVNKAEAKETKKTTKMKEEDELESDEA